MNNFKIENMSISDMLKIDQKAQSEQKYEIYLDRSKMEFPVLLSMYLKKHYVESGLDCPQEFFPLINNYLTELLRLIYSVDKITHDVLPHGYGFYKIEKNNTIFVYDIVDMKKYLGADKYLTDHHTFYESLKGNNGVLKINSTDLIKFKNLNQFSLNELGMYEEKNQVNEINYESFIYRYYDWLTYSEFIHVEDGILIYN